MNRTLAIVLALAVSVTPFGCKKDEKKKSASEAKFASLAVEHSALHKIDKGRGSIAFCLGMIGFSEEERRKAESWFPANISKAINSWNALLAKHPKWAYQDDLMINEIQQDKACEPSADYLSINVWADAAQFRKEFCDARHAVICTSSAVIEQESIFIGPVYGDKPVDIYRYFTILHEYGHLLGLGDTYMIPGYQEWQGDQPPSVMNGKNSPIDKLADDDRMGLWAVLNEIRTGKRSCDGFGTTVEVKFNAWKVLMCDPKARSAVASSTPAGQ